MRVYIMGPMSGLPDRNREAFYHAEAKLMTLGHNVINPAREDDKQYERTWLDYILYDLRLLQTCHGVYRLRGWQNSNGAMIENIVAHKLGLRVMDEGEDQTCAICFKEAEVQTTAKGQDVNPDEMFLRDKLYKWGRRLVESDNQNIQALIALQNYFIAKYGFKRFCEVKREVDIEVASSLL